MWFIFNGINMGYYADQLYGIKRMHVKHSNEWKIIAKLKYKNLAIHLVSS